MTAEEAISFIHEKVWQGSKPGLSRTRELLSKMGTPQKKLRFVHIAGTNGKGSTSAMISSILTSAGLRTGLYTSPYI
ncbi:MAG: bifunctional folylpolyglutamate synthase/dihydrofolate synthase, partial [Clostridiales bacterium]|nr:bifunctional folylpolyglutamate synthase/dihydrofolate synthase [Clostridiales bacterium]